MVTIITDRLKKQSLDDTIFPDLISPNLKPAPNPRFLGLKGHGVLYNARRLRSRTSDVKEKAKLESRANNAQHLGNSFGSFPPSCKKFCRSTPELTRASQPPELTISKVKWKPEPSSIWMPKGKASSDHRTLNLELSSSCDGLRENLDDATSGVITTPPDSPTPRPASANAIYDAKWGDQNHSLVNIGSYNPSKVTFHRKLSRSRSHPCVTTRRNKRGGVKRPFSEERPALDLDKMEETAYRRDVFHLKDVQMPKCMNLPLREPLPDISTKQPCFMLKPIIGSPIHTSTDCQSTALDTSSSIMITPNSSPIKEFIDTDFIESYLDVNCTEERTTCKDDNLENIYDEGIFELDSDLDIDSIEGDN